MGEVTICVAEIVFTCILLFPRVFSVPGSGREKVPLYSGSSGVHLLPRFHSWLKVIFACRKRKVWVEMRSYSSEIGVLRFNRLLDRCGGVERYKIREVII